MLPSALPSSPPCSSLLSGSAESSSCSTDVRYSASERASGRGTYSSGPWVVNCLTRHSACLPHTHHAEQLSHLERAAPPPVVPRHARHHRLAARPLLHGTEPPLATPVGLAGVSAFALAASSTLPPPRRRLPRRRLLCGRRGGGGGGESSDGRCGQAAHAAGGAADDEPVGSAESACSHHE